MATTPQTPQRSASASQQQRPEHDPQSHTPKDAPHDLGMADKDSRRRPDREAMRRERMDRLDNEDSIVNEQMQRSREIETIGVEAWKQEQDQRPEEERPVIVRGYIAAGDVLNTPLDASKRVPGISHPTTETPQRAPVRNPDGSLPPNSPQR
jgi:hypothetical protein